MKVTVTTLNDEIFVLDVSEDLELENFKAFCEIESGFPAKDITLNYNGKPLLDDKKSLKEHGVHDGDVVVLLHMVQSGSDLNVDDASQGFCFIFLIILMLFLLPLSCSLTKQSCIVMLFVIVTLHIIVFHNNTVLMVLTLILILIHTSSQMLQCVIMTHLNIQLSKKKDCHSRCFSGNPF